MPAPDRSKAENLSRHGRLVSGTTVAGRYCIVSWLGEDEMGEVYGADDLVQGRAVALRFLAKDLTGDRQRLERFNGEVQQLRQILHPNVCRVYDAGEFSGRHFVSTEYIEGESLKSLLLRVGTVSRKRGIQFARQLCAGLAAAHEQGVLHGNLKPGNVMIEGRGHVRMTDFALAAVIHDWVSEATLVGAAAYMSPEQLRRVPASVQSDIYSLGLVLYEVFAGEQAYPSASHTDVDHHYHDSSPPRRPPDLVADMDPSVERIIMLCLENDPQSRPQSVASVLAALPGEAGEQDSVDDRTEDTAVAQFGLVSADEHTVDSMAEWSGYLEEDDKIGTVLAGYELVQRIGRGGMGVVYKAYQKSLDRFIALKIIRSAEFADEVEIQRFRQEAQAAASLDHPNIVPVHEVGFEGGLHFFSMGFIEGHSLADRLADGPLDPRTSAKLTLDVAEAVHYAHLHGVIHRDLKPDNILLDDAGNPRVTDFGLAKRTECDAGLTATGQVLGTPGYMSPEQAEGESVCPLTDVYSLGALLYALLAGHPPFRGKSSFDILRQVREDLPAPIRSLDPSIPRDLDAIALKCLEKPRSRRYQSASEVKDDLERFLRGEATTARLPSATERAWRWCSRRRRIDDVARLTLIVSAIFCLWNLLGVFSLATGILPTDDVVRSLWIVGLDFLGFVVFLCLGLATFSGRLPVLWMGLAASVGVLAFSIACLTGWPYFDGGGWLKDPLIRVPVFLFFTVMASIQVAAYAVALVAGYSTDANGRSEA